MASLATHFTAFLFLFPTGLNRLFSSSSLYLQNPSLYRSKSCYLSNPRYKNLHLYILCVSLPIASFTEFFLFLTFSSHHHHHPTYRFSFFLQSASLLVFWLLCITFLLRENLVEHPFVFDDGFLFVFAAVSFLVEFSVIGMGVVGVGGVVYDLLGKLTLVCVICCLVLSVKPTSFWADFVLCCGMVFKGTWVLQAGLNLYTDSFGLKGCRKIITVLPSQVSVDVLCGLEEDALRGVALVNLLFVGHAIGVFVLGVLVFGLLSIYRNLRCGGEASGPLLAELDSYESMLMRGAHADLEME